MLEWLSDVERAADPGYDPLRSRLQFLDLLPKNDQREFLNDVEAALDRTKAPISKANPVQSLHKVWKEGRRNWFRHFRDALKK